MMTNKKAAMPPPTDRPNMIRRPEQNLWYGPLRRVWDRVSGRTDGRHSTVRLNGIEALTSTTSMWLARSAATHDERVEHERLVHHALLSPVVIRRDAVDAQLPEIIQQLHDAREAARNLKAPDLERRGPAEQNVADSVIQLRRRREHDATVAGPAARRVADLETRLAELTREKNELDAQITVVTQVTDTRIARLGAYYARREHTYRRAYLRAASKAQSTSGVPSQARVIRQEAQQ